MLKKIVLILTAVCYLAGNSFAEENEPEVSPTLAQLTKGYILDVSEQIEQLKQTIADDFADDFVNYCIVIICIAAICSVGMKIIKSLQKGSMIDLNSLLLPFFFIFIVSSYRPMTEFISYTTGGFEYFIASKCNNIDEELNTLRDKKIEVTVKINKLNYEKLLEKANGWLFAELWYKFQHWWDDIEAKYLNFDYVVGYFFLVLLFISGFIVRIAGGILTIILYVIGPFVLGISAFPVFKDTWKTWLSTFIWAQLFAPVCQIISYILANLEKNALLNDIQRLEEVYANYSDIYTQPISESFFSGITYIAFMAAGIMMFWCVPTICSWIVPAQGGSTLSVLTGMLSKTTAAGITFGKKQFIK